MKFLYVYIEVKLKFIKENNSSVSHNYIFDKFLHHLIKKKLYKKV